VAGRAREDQTKGTAVRFWLGTHNEAWLASAGVPLFVSHTRLKRRKRLPVACEAWALDSGGFTELDRHGGWQTTVEEYVEAVARYGEEVGRLAWAAPMDWMCEPHMLDRTGLSVREHQERTVGNFLELRGRGPFVPVLQGWTLDDYLRCVGLYEEAGVDLRSEALVGLGTVCRRQDTREIAQVVGELASLGLSLHGFGMKSRGLARVGHLVASADSLAWSVAARYDWQHRGRKRCRGDHRGSCANCQAWALRWREGVLDRLGLFAA
jgi:hypothetical protein